MCFSAEVSFVSGALLMGTGIQSVRKSTPNQVYFAMIPLFFSVQQLAEGFLWVSHSHDWSILLIKYLNNIYLFFAFLVWPIWLTWSIYKMEGMNLWIQRISYSSGIITVLYLGYLLLNANIDSEILCYHIRYNVNIPYYTVFALTYVVTTTLPFWASKNIKLRIIGSLTGIGFLISAIFYNSYFVSVWCFFAAIISLLAYYVIVSANRNKA